MFFAVIKRHSNKEYSIDLTAGKKGILYEWSTNRNPDRHDRVSGPDDHDRRGFFQEK